MELKYVDYILDNIHGYISLTEIESKIEKLPIFRRLRGLKQLGLTNWIFPGAEHTRYSHSLGVMHIADKIALKLNFSNKERQFLRVCAMLHDIGHFPLSHVGERAYKSYYENKSVLKSLGEYENELKDDNLTNKNIVKNTFLKKSGNPFHHENLGETIINESLSLKEILSNYDICVKDVCEVITGEIKNYELIKYIQILHSEMDADRIDYLLRDTFSSGTSYGAFEINTLIKNLEIKKHHYFDIEVIGVNQKGIMSADQFLINRYFVYTQVFYHKYVTVLSAMCEIIINNFLKQRLFVSPEDLLKNVHNHEHNDEFFNFNDAFFIEYIRKHIDGDADIKKMISSLTSYQIPKLSEKLELNNLIVSGKNNLEILDAIYKYKILDFDVLSGDLQKIDSLFLTEHIKTKDFIDLYDKNKCDISLDNLLMSRIINGVSFIHDNEISMLYDCDYSLVKDLLRHRTLFIRTFTL